MTASRDDNPSIGAPPVRFGMGGWRPAAAVIVVAVVAAGFAVVFHTALAAVLEFFGGSSSFLTVFQEAPIWARLLAPAVGGLAAGGLAALLQRAPASHGVGDVMEAVVLGRVHLSMRITLLKSAASWLAIVSGGSIGREGPLIQFGGASGSLVGEWFRLQERQRRVLIAAGTAAGFAAAYNTPFAAILFVLEVVTGVFALEAVIPALLATVISTELTRAILGPGPIYGHREFSMHSSSELFAYAGLGVVVAVCLQGFMALLGLGEKAFRRPELPLPWRAGVGGLLAGAFVAMIPGVAGNGYETLNAVLSAKFAAAQLVLLVLGKCLATVSSVSSGSPGGVFTPVLLIGGCIGSLYGAALSDVAGLPALDAGSYALVGMAAATAATTHAPVMAAVMVFELSGDYAIALPLLLATALATFLSKKMRTDSIYTRELRARGRTWDLTLEGRTFR